MIQHVLSGPTTHAQVQKPPKAFLRLVHPDNYLGLETRSDESSVNTIEKIKTKHSKRQTTIWIRPECFGNAWREAACIICICMSHVPVEYFNLGFILMLSTILKQIGEQNNKSVWPISAYHIIICAFTIPMRKIQDRIGSWCCFVSGLAWLGLCSLLAGYVQTFWMLCLCRALSGIGPAAFVAFGVNILEKLYPSGPRKHLVNYLYAASSSLGVFSGLLAAGLTSTCGIRAGWFFWIGASLSLCTAVLSSIAFPSSVLARRTKETSEDLNWPSSTLLVSGLSLVLSTITQGATTPSNWRKPLLYELLFLGLALLVLTVIIERRYTLTPLLTQPILSLPKMKSLLLVVLLDSGLTGTCLAFGARLLQQTSNVTTLRLVLWYLPIHIAGPAVSLFDFWVRNGPRTSVVIWSQYCWIVAVTVIAVSPVANGSYWAFAFTGMVFASVASFSTFDAASIFIYHSLRPKYECLASTIVNFLKHLGVALFLGLEDNLRSALEVRYDLSGVEGIKSVFWFAVVVAGLAMVVAVGWVRIDDCHQRQRTGSDGGSSHGSSGRGEVKKLEV